MSYRFADHLHAAQVSRKAGPSRADCPSCGETITAGSDECPFCGASVSFGERQKTKGRWFAAAAWLLILAFTVPTLLWLLSLAR